MYLDDKTVLSKLVKKQRITTNKSEPIIKIQYFYKKQVLFLVFYSYYQQIIVYFSKDITTIQTRILI